MVRSAPSRKRGQRDGTLTKAVAAAVRGPGDVTPGWLMAELDLSRRQADNALSIGLRRGSLQCVARGVYRAR